MNISKRTTKARRPSTPRPPVEVGQRILAAQGLTALPAPVWATVDLINWVLAEEILRGNAEALPWKVSYRIDPNPDGGPEATQLGVVYLDDRGHDAAGLVLDIDPAPRT